MSKVNFFHNGPVQPDNFVNREIEVNTCLRNIFDNRASVIVTGEPKIGKTSLLLKINDTDTQRDYLGEDVASFKIFYLNMQTLGPKVTPQTFWQMILRPVRKYDEVKQFLEELQDEDYNLAMLNFDLEMVMQSLQSENTTLVILLDEIEALLAHENFQHAGFWGLLRELYTRFGLVLCLAARLSAERLQTKYTVPGSPFWNGFDNRLLLRPFDESAFIELIGGKNSPLSSQEQKFVRRVAGKHPYLVQKFADMLIEQHSEKESELATIAAAYYQQVKAHFNDTWNVLAYKDRTVLFLLSLVELGQRASGRAFAQQQIESRGLNARLGQLSRNGYVDEVTNAWPYDPENAVACGGSKWTLSTQSFAWWVYDVVVRGESLPDNLSVTDLYSNEAFIELLSSKDWVWLVEKVRYLCGKKSGGIAMLAKDLLKEMVDSEMM